MFHNIIQGVVICLTLIIFSLVSDLLTKAAVTEINCKKNTKETIIMRT